MRIIAHDVVCLSSSIVRRMAEEYSVPRWVALSDAQVTSYMTQRVAGLSVSHVELCNMFPAHRDDDAEVTAGRPVEAGVTVTDAPAEHGWRLFRSFGLDQAILTYWYGDA